MTRMLMFSRLAIPGFLLLSVLTLGVVPLPVQAQSSEPLIVEADDSLQWRREDRQYIATGNAIASQGDTVMQADVITADYLESSAESGDSTDENTEDKIDISRIVGEGAARLDNGGYSATAEKITYDLNQDMARLEGGKIKVTSQTGSITATETVIYDRARKIMVAIGEAEILLQNGQRLNGDRIEVDINEAENDFTAIRAFGGAEVFSPNPAGDRQARAESIDYIQETGIATLEGNVKVFDGPNKMTGDKAVVNTLTGVSTMTSTSGRVGGVFTP